ncbi:MAG: ABC transporter ATP-binding protein [Scytonema sp. PMC 1069.18]|nr:ABC transporter ATP-binding protein [Scytonema sp. PMC 1069.18]MEC4888306.1 ABC transporter ATP-binding protein [Scytonema sp. PMC 1070.18]
MADFKLNSKKLTTNTYQYTSISPTAILAERVEMVIQSKQQGLQILKQIDWKIPKGNIEILMGPSGSGKTTLLSILAGLLTPTSGNVYLLGQDITKMSRKQLSQFRRNHIGFIFQDFNLFPALTAIENVEAALNLKGIRGKQAYQQAQAMLEMVELGDKAQQLPRDLSGGQKQRVAIARALTGNPQLIMADEPTAALDSHSGHLVMELLRRLAKEQGCTVLIVTHDPRILDLADRIAHIEDGMLK